MSYTDDVEAAARQAQVTGFEPADYEYGCRCGDTVYIQQNRGFAHMAVVAREGSCLVRRPVGVWEPDPDEQTGGAA